MTDGSDANALVEDHLYLVQHVVNQLASRYPRHIDRGELWSAGATGLVDASRRYEPATGVPFARYAMIRIRGAIIDSTRTRDWATRSLRRSMRALGDTTESFEQEHGRAPTISELASALGMDEEQVLQRRSAAAAANLLHFDQPLPGQDAEEGGAIGDRLADPDRSVMPEVAVEHIELTGTVRVAVQYLPEVQREVIERYFFAEQLLRDIAEDLGVTEARVSQIRSEALNAIRCYFASNYDEVDEVPRDAPGRRRRAAYLAEVTGNITWRSRLEAGTEPVLSRGA